jgi:hypothetical protein
VFINKILNIIQAAKYPKSQGINDTVGEFVRGVGEVGEVAVVAGESKRNKRSMGCNL